MANIIVFEGPAGSGKTTLYNYLLGELEGIDIELVKKELELPSVPRPRSYEGKTGISLALTKDWLTTLAIVSSVDHDRPILVDRWYISGWVYNLIRSKNIGQHHIAPSDLALLQHYVRDQRLMISSTYLEMATRNNIPVNVSPKLDIHYLFLIPTVNQLKENRVKSGKPASHYPYSPEAEICHYLEAYHAISSAETTQPFFINYHYHLFQPSTLAQYLLLPKVVTAKLLEHRVGVA